MKKLSLLLACTLFFFTGCGASHDADSEFLLTVGAVLPLTGPASFVGEELNNGLQLALTELNAVNPKRVQLVVDDSQSKPDLGVSAFRNIDTQYPADVYLSSLSSVSLAIAPLAEEKRIPLMGLVTTAPSLTKDRDYVFRYYPTAKDEAEVLAQQLNGSSHIGVLYLNDDFGQQMLKEIARRVEPLVVSENYMKSEKDFRTLISKFKAQDVDALVAIGFDSHLRNIFEQLHELGFKGKILSSSTMTLPDVRDQLGDKLDGLMLPAPVLYHASSTEAAAFAKEYMETYGREASHYAAVGYDALMLLGKDLQYEGVGREDMHSKLRSLNAYAGLFGDMRIDGQEFAYPLLSARIESGDIQYMDSPLDSN